MPKKLSGAAFRRKAREKEEEAQKSSSLMSTWLRGNVENDCGTTQEVSESIFEHVSTDEPQVLPHESRKEEAESIYSQEWDLGSTSTTEEMPGTSNTATAIISTHDPSAGQQISLSDFKDPGTWPECISDATRCLIVEKLSSEEKTEPDLSGSLREGRKLSKDWFYKQLPNGQKVCRSWLGYSKSKNALFCIPCKLFRDNISEAKLSHMAKNGLTQWKKLNEKIPEHENSLSHKKGFCSWKTLEASLNKGGIDKELQQQISEEEKHWKSVLVVIVDVILHLAKQGSPFRGSDERLDFGDPRCGKFLNTIDLLSRYHPALREHIRRHKKGQLSYFSHGIQDQFLEIIGSKIRAQIISEIKEAKYFSVMFDCTPDVSHYEQMSQIIRYVKFNESGAEVCERFIDFLTISDKTGQALSQIILQKIESDGLDFKNCRGQSYDNGANMAGKYKGVQSRLQQENKLAYFVPCAAHSLNLVGVNAASASRDAETYFGIINCLYLFFASSTNRWEIMLKNVPVSLKLQSSTRWSTKREAVAVVHKHLKEVIDALQELITSATSSPETKTEAKNLLKNVSTFEFITASCFWFKQLTRIDIVNKILQKEDITIDRSVKHINQLIEEFQEARINATEVTDIISEAKAIAEKLNLEPQFKELRKRKRKRMVDEDCEDESCDWTAEKRFHNTIAEIIDNILHQLRNRFHALENINNLFGFLHGAQLQAIKDDDIKIQAMQLADTYNNDLNKDELIIELQSFKYHAVNVIPTMKTATPAKILSLICQNGLQDAYPNVTTALRIFVTMPVSVSANERSFSKLKQIKTYLRNRMAQQRLTDLSIISIEHQLASNISFDAVINTFAERKARKIQF